MNKIYVIFLIMFALVLSSCEASQDGSSDRGPASQSDPGATPVPTPSPTATPKPSPTVTPSPTPSTSEAKPLWDSKAVDGTKWTAWVMDQLDTLGKDMLNITPADYATFCPRYTKLTYTEKKEFYTYLMSAMTKYESNFKPTEYYQENFKDSSGNYVVSRGLLQISIESGNAYGCAFKTENDLYDPYQNLSCGIRILNRWIGQRDLRIAGQVSGSWRGGARYWSTLRSTNSGSYSSIVSLAKGTSLCTL